MELAGQATRLNAEIDPSSPSSASSLKIGAGLRSGLPPENRLAKGEFVALRRRLNLRNITCPVYLLAGAADDVTTPEQVLDAAKYLGTARDRMVQMIVPGGHIGLFMGAKTLKDHWPPIARWIVAQ